MSTQLGTSILEVSLQTFSYLTTADFLCHDHENEPIPTCRMIIRHLNPIIGPGLAVIGEGGWARAAALLKVVEWAAPITQASVRLAPAAASQTPSSCHTVAHVDWKN